MIERVYLPKVLWGISLRSKPLHLELFAESGHLQEPFLYSSLDLREIHGPASVLRAKKHLTDWAMSITTEAIEIKPLEVSIIFSG